MLLLRRPNGECLPSTANSTRGNRQQRHGLGEIGKVLQGEPKVGIKGKECHKHRLWVFENGVLRVIFGSKRNEVIGEWRKLRSEELHNLYLSPNIIRR
jgi:hypothetical protein